MAEHSTNAEIAHKLHEKIESKRSKSKEKEKLEERLEILEAFLLAIVAITTAWSGYQAARWDGNSALNYAGATALRVDGDHAATLGGQQRLHDISTFNTWLQAKTAGNSQMTGLLERRFSKDYQPGFRAWLETDPFHNLEAPPGPAFMPQYKNKLESEGAELLKQANEAFESAHSAREFAEDYVRLTVFLATILFMVAIAQGFRSKLPKFGLLGVAIVAMGVILMLLFMYPRA